jgi:hypothetical protein
MAKVICTLPNASESINGVKFVADRGQMISEDVADDVAAHFVSIPGYVRVPTEAELAAAAAAAEQAAAAERAAAEQAVAAEKAKGKAAPAK